MKIKKIVTLGCCFVIVFSATLNQVKAQNSEKKIRDNREKVQKADSIDKTINKQKKKIKHNSDKDSNKN